MEKETNPMQALCRSGCGFYGSPSTEGFCSVCFKEALKKRQNDAGGIMDSSNLSTSSTVGPSSSSSTPAPSPMKATTKESSPEAKEECPSELPSTPSPSPSTSDKQEGKDPAKKKKNICATCRKKVGLTGFECRCGGLYCGLHRYSDKHDCTFNYRELGAQEIRRNNLLVISEKVPKI